MYFLYYENTEKHLILTESMQNARSLELLESNPVLEKLIVRIEMYKKQYRCEVVNEVETKPDTRTVNKIKNINKPRERRSAETRQRMSEARSGEGNSQWGVPNTPEMKAAKSAKLKEHYKYHVHGKEGYRDSEETRRMKSINNNNKGGWFWICNAFTKEERRCYGEVPTGWRRGRLHNYIKYIKKD
jgi:hypothetical protein